jgi:DnaJ-class molecular chaperone
VYGTGTITITNQYDQLNEKVKFLEASLDNEIKRINNLSTDIKSLKERQDKSKYSVDYQESKPYKCPVCDGCGNTKGQIEPMPNYEFSMKYATCHSCEGNGIVWS